MSLKLNVIKGQGLSKLNDWRCPSSKNEAWKYETYTNESFRMIMFCTPPLLSGSVCCYGESTHPNDRPMTNTHPRPHAHGLNQNWPLQDLEKHHYKFTLNNTIWHLSGATSFNSRLPHISKGNYVGSYTCKQRKIHSQQGHDLTQHSVLWKQNSKYWAREERFVGQRIMQRSNMTDACGAFPKLRMRLLYPLI